MNQEVILTDYGLRFFQSFKKLSFSLCRDFRFSAFLLFLFECDFALSTPLSTRCYNSTGTRGNASAASVTNKLTAASSVAFALMTSTQDIFCSK